MESPVKLRDLEYWDRMILFGVCAVIAVAMAVMCYVKPRNDWDRIAFTGAALSWSIKSPTEVQALTYQYLRQATSTQRFHKLVDGPPNPSYRRAVYHDPKVFALQLRFYKPAVIYIGLTWLGWKLGFNPIRTQSAISAFAAGCGALVVAWIFVQELGFAGLIAFPAVLVASKLFATGKIETPDALCALVVFSGLWLIRDRRALASNLGFTLLLLALWIRIDAIILLLSCCLAMAVFSLWEKETYPPVRNLAIYSILGLATWLVIDRMAPGFGWEILIHQSFTKILIHPFIQYTATSAKDLTFRWSDYVAALKFGIKAISGTWRSKSFAVMFMVGSGLLYFAAKSSDPNHLRDASLLAAGLMYMAGHFLAFPAPWFRFFTPIYLFTMAIGLILLRDAIVALPAANARDPSPD